MNLATLIFRSPGEYTVTLKPAAQWIPERLDNRPRFWKARAVKQSIVTLDLEGVLVPEIWIAVAERTGVKELRLTTREVPDYDELMKYRLNLLAQHGLTLSLIQDVIGTLEPLPGGKEFLAELRSLTQVIILSDTFEEFAKPLMRQLDWPAIFCHRLEVENDRITNYRLRLSNQKQKAVAAFKSLNYHIIAAGDAFNDTAMLGEAHVGFLFRSPLAVQQQFPQFKALESYEELLTLIKANLA